MKSVAHEWNNNDFKEHIWTYFNICWSVTAVSILILTLVTIFHTLFLKRLFKRYHEKGDLKERLVINHLVVLYNVFDREAATRMLVFKLENYLHYLKPFLVMMGYWPRTIDGINGISIDGEGVPVNTNVVELLRRI